MKQRIDILSPRQAPHPSSCARLFGWSVATLLACGLGLALAQPVHPFPWEESMEPRSNNPDLPFIYGRQYDPEKYKRCMESEPPGVRRHMSWTHCEEYRQKIPKFDPSRRDLFGEQFDLQKYGACKNRVASNDSACDMWAVYRRHEPEFWPYPEVPRPKWPEPPTVQTYQPGMTTDQYYKALCEKEAGVWVYRKVENVDAIFDMRPRRPIRDEEIRDRYALEDPYGYDIVGPRSFLDRPVGFPLGYPFLEYAAYSRIAWTESAMKFVRYSPIPSAKVIRDVKREETDELRARYGFTWRGIARPMDRQLGIAGGEMLVVDLKTGEVLALRRGFLLGGSDKRVHWDRMVACPRASTSRSYGKDDLFTLWMLNQVFPRDENKK